MTLDEAKLAELERIGKAATAPEWRLSGQGDDQCIIQTNHITRDVWTIPHNLGDMPFIATARNEWQNLIDEVRRLRKENSVFLSYASYCRSCALSGEHNPQTLSEFKATITKDTT